MRTLAYFAVAVLSLLLAACADEEFGDYQAHLALESNPTKLDGEQVILSQNQVDCGVHEELWTLESLGNNRTAGRLSDKARALNFADDIRIGDGLPYAQVRGKFRLQVSTVASIRDKEPGVKVVEAKVGIKIDHSCFANALPLMGVRKGEFTTEYPSRFLVAQRGSWVLDEILH